MLTNINNSLEINNNISKISYIKLEEKIQILKKLIKILEKDKQEKINTINNFFILIDNIIEKYINNIILKEEIIKKLEINIEKLNKINIKIENNLPDFYSKNKKYKKNEYKINQIYKNISQLLKNEDKNFIHKLYEWKKTFRSNSNSIDNFYTYFTCKNINSKETIIKKIDEYFNVKNKWAPESIINIFKNNLNNSVHIFLNSSQSEIILNFEKIEKWNYKKEFKVFNNLLSILETFLINQKINEKKELIQNYYLEIKEKIKLFYKELSELIIIWKENWLLNEVKSLFMVYSPMEYNEIFSYLENKIKNKSLNKIN